jgi:uroporphyrinogen-III synthase
LLADASSELQWRRVIVPQAACMQPKVVAILETRTGERLAELVAREGAIPLLAPALEEVPDLEPGALAGLLESWRVEPFAMAIFQTGVGTRALFQTADEQGSTALLKRLLEPAIVVVRGPKPTAELNARGVRIDIRAPSPFTTESVLEAVAAVALTASRVLVQRYGESNRQLCEALKARGAAVHEMATYRWELPKDTAPLLRLLDELAAGRIDAALFTSAVQVQNLYAVAERAGRAGDLAQRLNAVIVGSIGPVCTRALRGRGITPAFEASPPKLGPLLNALNTALKAR